MTKLTWFVAAIIAVLLFGSAHNPANSALPFFPKAHAASLSFVLVGYAGTGWNSSNPSITVSPGDSVSFALSSGDSFTHRFVVDVDRDGKIFSPTCPPDKCSMAFPPSTTYPFTVDFAAGTYTYYCAYHPNSMFGNFIVQSPPTPDFSINASPASVSVAQGSSTTSTINLASLNGFAGTVTVNSVPSPTGLPLSPATTTVTLAAGGTGSFVLTFSPTTANAAGTYTVTATGTSGSLSHPATVAVTVVGPDFTISDSVPTPQSFVAGNSATSTITLTSLMGFAGSVNLAASTTYPVTGLTFAFSVNPVTLAAGGTGTSTLTISTTPSTPSGNYPVFVTGTAMGGIPHAASSYSFIVTGFSISSSPTTLGIVQGLSGNSTITLTSLNGFSGNVSLTATVTPSGPSATLNPPTVTLSAGTSGQSTVHVSTSSGIYSSTSPGPYTVNVTGTSGSISHSTILTIIVTSGSSGTGTLPTYAIVGVVVAIVAAVAVAILVVRRRKPKK